MPTVTVYTAARMKEIEDNTIVSAEVVNGRLVLTRHDGTTADGGPVNGTGVDGASAYELAVANGFVGTEAQWLASLEGPAGPAGPAGPTGATGAQGPQGIQGPAVPLSDDETFADASTTMAPTERAVKAAIAAIDTSGGTGGTGTTNPLLMPGNQVKLVYRATPARWEFPNGTVPDLTGRVASITWEGTAAQIPAQGTTVTSFMVGDTADVRSTSL